MQAWYHPYLLFLLGMLATYAIGRLTRRQDRREDWYKNVETQFQDVVRWRAEMGQKLSELTRLIERLDLYDAETHVRDMGAQVQQLNYKVDYRLEKMEEKLGPFFRAIEQYVATDLLRPPSREREYRGQ